MTGRVQGVGFRASTVSAAAKFPNLKGFIRNLPDGRVEAVFAGDQNDVLQMVAWCKTGPEGAQVLALEVKEEAFDPALTVFAVRR